MGIILWLVIGGVIGWLASIVMRTDGSQGIFLNIVVGIIGAFLGGWLIGPMVGAGSINSGDISLTGLLVSFLGGPFLRDRRVTPDPPYGSGHHASPQKKSKYSFCSHWVGSSPSCMPVSSSHCAKRPASLRLSLR